MPILLITKKTKMILINNMMSGESPTIGRTIETTPMANATADRISFITFFLSIGLACLGLLSLINGK